VHSLYHRQFRRWFGIMAPTSLLAGLVLVLADMRIRDIFRNIHRGEFASHVVDIAAAGALRYGSFFLSWVLGCFALAAIATVVSQYDAEENGGVWRHDSYERARQNLSAIFLAGLIMFCLFLTGTVVCTLVWTSTIRIIGRSRFEQFNYAIALVLYVFIGGIVSWLGVAIPLIVGGKIRLGAALRKSLKLSNGYELALFLLVVESAVGGLVAWYVTLHGLRLIVPDQLRYTFWYGWLVNVVGVLASAAVDPPLFLGLSLLANPERFKQPSAPCAQQPSNV
jgi:branched-subunit amino acid transport protein